MISTEGSPREELVAEMTAAMICGVVGIASVKVETYSPPALAGQS